MDLDNIIVPDDISVQSNEERIVIDPITRVINIPEDYIIGVESDEKSDRMYFQCPKIVGDNVDLSKLKLYVNFENANKERDNDGFGNGFGAWFWVILILLFCNNGWGNNNIANDTLLDDEFIKRDIFNTNQNVSNSACQTQRDVLESRYTTQLGMQNLQASQQECCCTTQRAIDNVVAQDYKNTCEITTAIHAEGEATRALINANTMQELRDRLADRDRDLLTANFQLSQQAQSANIISTLQPTPKPAYLTCSPYYAYNSGACFGNGCGCNGTNL